jgi:hypothetical protein
MSFEYDNPHNHYLWLYFDMGLIGLGTFWVLIWRLVATARNTVESADQSTRVIMIGFIFGLLSLVVGVFFVLLIVPWTYIWATTGAIMRLALTAQKSSEAAIPAAAERSYDGVRFGWRASPVSYGTPAIRRQR